MRIRSQSTGFMLLRINVGSETPVFPNLNINSNPDIYLYQGTITLYTQSTSRA